MAKQWRWTNRRAIDFLLPMAREVVEQFQRGEITLEPVGNPRVTKARARWERSRFPTGPNGEQCHVVLSVIDWGDDKNEHVTVNATLLLDRGKYDTMTVGWIRWRDGYGQIQEGWGFSKEFRGMGNGYYADIDPITGKIIRGEWD